MVINETEIKVAYINMVNMVFGRGMKQSNSEDADINEKILQKVTDILGKIVVLISPII